MENDQIPKKFIKTNATNKNILLLSGGNLVSKKIVIFFFFLKNVCHWSSFTWVLQIVNQ